MNLSHPRHQRLKNHPANLSFILFTRDEFVHFSHANLMRVYHNDKQLSSSFYIVPALTLQR